MRGLTHCTWRGRNSPGPRFWSARPYSDSGFCTGTK